MGLEVEGESVRPPGRRRPQEATRSPLITGCRLFPPFPPSSPPLCPPFPSTHPVKPISAFSLLGELRRPPQQTTAPPFHPNPPPHTAAPPLSLPSLSLSKRSLLGELRRVLHRLLEAPPVRRREAALLDGARLVAVAACTCLFVS